MSDLLGALRDARENTDNLFACVRTEALYDRPIPERHRIVFYVGHLEAFDWNLLANGPLDLPAFRPDFDRLFAFGIDPDASGLPADRPEDWPKLDDVRCYCTQVRQRLDRQLERAPEQLLHVAIEHRLMHSETLAYMLHNLPYDRKVPPAWRLAPNHAPPSDRSMVGVAARTVLLGRERGDGFGWDNEFPGHSVEVDPFSIGRYKVTNREYLAFVEEGAKVPHFWKERAGQWCYQGMFEEMPLPLDCPVYVTQREASAYARWKGCRLPSEREWHAASLAAPPPDPERDNFDFRYWDPVPVTAAADAPGPAQMTGNGWEWTSTLFEPFPGFEPFSFYPGYSANFFDGEHVVMKGASPRTAAALARPSFRNWFRPEYPYVYAGFRVVRD
jgi:ergothioneine biosynthesis protein EgtB